MNIAKVISVEGLGGLHKMVARTSSNGLVLESLVDKKRIPAFATQKMTTLVDTGIFTTGEDTVPMQEVFQKIYDKENGGPCLSHKQPDAELKAYFKSVLPDYDEARVHTSVIKKVLNWYNILKTSGLLDETEEVVSEEDKIKAQNAKDFENNKKGNVMDTGSSVKTSQSKVKAAGVRKTGVA